MDIPQILNEQRELNQQNLYSVVSNVPTRTRSHAERRNKANKANNELNEKIKQSNLEYIQSRISKTKA